MQKSEGRAGAETEATEAGRREEFKWKHNGLRHSFISYRVAVIKNVAQVALEAGNSPAMIFSNYRELVTPQDAKAWFAIVPAARAEGEGQGEAGRKARGVAIADQATA